ncbi:MAG TPA: transglycosylase SLT domain-containing protein [Devosiaceae bacterium]|nr:transglycosylase SLT domain-containing protein [Devosiaceae bacterium]
MFRVLPGPLRLLTAFALLVASGAPTFSGASASEAIDPIVTGSIDRSATAIPSMPQGSQGFRKALALVVKGDEAGAYSLASGLSNDLERRTIQWAAIYYGNGIIDYHAVDRFAADAPEFATEALCKTRLEQSLVTANPSDADVIKYLGGSTPQSIKGKILLAQAYVQAGERERAARLARATWVDNILDADSEKLVLSSIGSLLTRDDHWARTVHLLMNDRASSASRMVGKLSPAQKSLAVAGIAVVQNASNSAALLARVDPSLRTSALFYFMAAQQARQASDFTRALADLNAAHGKLPDAAEWWYERRTLIRQILMKGDAKLAYRAAATYTSGPEGRLVEARFHAGWIALSFLNDAKSAKPQFEKMLTLSTLPDSIAQGHYWLGRALLALGDRAEAKASFNKAARYSTTYYGLLARGELGDKAVDLRPLPAWREHETAFDAHDVVRAVHLLAANGQGSLAVPLLRKYVDGLKDGGQLLLAARLAQSIGAHYLAIEIADLGSKRGTPLDLFSYPMDPLPANMKLADVDKAAIYAVARQESRFRIDAVSRSGALGLMQLMPATAKETAAKMGLAYSASRLTSDGRYNALLGSTYLAGQLQQFSGSLALAAAGYNAGAGNVAKWVAAFGDPRSSNVDPVVWVELIPFEETRSYVQRVLSNYVIYRARLGSGQITMEQALRRIPA